MRMDEPSSNQPLISVVMPAYNHERYIGETIDSVLGQTWQNLELIIIDDGSTDRTAAIVKAYDDPRLDYFHQENQDAYNALNQGMAKAKGDYIAIINSDDVYLLNRFERLMPKLLDDGASCVFSDVSPVDDQSRPLDDPGFGWNHWHQANRDFYLEQKGDVYRGFLHGNYMVTTSNLLMTREAMQAVGDFSPIRYLHDYDFIFRMMLAFPEGVLYVDDEILMNYRIHGGNTLSEAAIIGREQDQEIIRRFLLAKCPDALHGIIETGVDRLVTINKELIEVRQQLSKETHSTIPVQDVTQLPSRLLLATLLKRLGSKFSIR